MLLSVEVSLTRPETAIYLGQPFSNNFLDKLLITYTTG